MLTGRSGPSRDKRHDFRARVYSFGTAAGMKWSFEIQAKEHGSDDWIFWCGPIAIKQYTGHGVPDRWDSPWKAEAVAREDIEHLQTIDVQNVRSQEYFVEV